MTGERYEAGMEARRRVLGTEYLDNVLAGVTELDADWQRVLTEFCWGTVWTGTALSDRQRSLNTLCLLGAGDRETEFRLHLKGALKNGVTVPEITETLIQIAVYAGVPAGVQAFRVAREVLVSDGSTSTD